MKSWILFTVRWKLLRAPSFMMININPAPRKCQVQNKHYERAQKLDVFSVL